jgi:hypothetical protein
MPRCTAITAIKGQCTRESLVWGDLCRLHLGIWERREKAAGPVHEGRCAAILSGKPLRRCHKPVDGGEHCKLHDTIHARHEQRERELRAEIAAAERERAEHLREVIVRYTAMVEGRDDWTIIMRRLEQDYGERVVVWAEYVEVLKHVAHLHPAGYREALPFLRDEARRQRHDLYGAIVREFVIEENPYVGAGAGPVPIHQDHQSVHRAEVSEQTNRGIKILLDTAIPAGQNTLNQLLQTWSTYGPSSLAKLAHTYVDVAHWYKQSYCRNPDDYYYRRVLDHAVALADSSPHKDDLYRRLFEEATDAVKMCCDGHINRIINAFVGIVDGFDCPVSTKELLQTRLAAISATDKTTEEKQKNAREVLAELRVPEAEHAVWLEAF